MLNIVCCQSDATLIVNTRRIQTTAINYIWVFQTWIHFILIRSVLFECVSNLDVNRRVYKDRWGWRSIIQIVWRPPRSEKINHWGLFYGTWSVRHFRILYTTASLILKKIRRHFIQYSKPSLSILKRLDLSGFPALQKFKFSSVDHWPWREWGIPFFQF